jgi:hypothetical protein
MRFLCVYKPAQEEGGRPSPEHVAEMGKLIDTMTKAGVLLATEGCLPSSKGARVRLAKGKVSVVDGPFTETKELIGGFAIIRVNSKAEAIEWTERFLHVAGDGESEIRQLYEPSDFADQSTGANKEATAKA